jgi:hypothetical protein
MIERKPSQVFPLRGHYLKSLDDFIVTVGLGPVSFLSHGRRAVYTFILLSSTASRWTLTISRILHLS